jgi:protein phosphatase 2C family protein 2/3
VYSSDNEFNQNDIIKAYAYNTTEGNIRDYNEDTITATKLIFEPKDKNDKNNYAYFFGIYDGHGGDGCSVYLKNNLHKNITEPTVKSLKSAIAETEKNFLEKVAINSLGELDDCSGSCGVMVLIKNRKCIIANLGDSRCVLYRKKRIVFSTRDHKPNTDFERKRIEAAGGTVYQAQMNLDLYQNGKLVEIPYRVEPGGLSVSRTFGDIESKDEKFGGKKGVVSDQPDIVEFELSDEHNFLVMGCDGIFDVLSNIEIMECIKIVLRIHKDKKKKINELCADFASMIIKSALAKESFDNVSCIVVVFNVNDII